MTGEDWYLRMIRWRENHIKESNFILILSLVVGILTALAAWLLKSSIHLIQSALTSFFSIESANFLYLLYPAVGIFLASWYVRRVVKDDIGHGVTHILYAISRRQGRLKRHNIWTSLIASSVTIGMGGSVGAEAPIVLTGSAIGSNLGSYFKMNHKTLMVLIGCGAAGAISGIFKAPIAGMLFTIEVLMLDLTAASVMPLLISSVTAATLSYILTGSSSMFAFSMEAPFELSRIPWVLVLGVSCGLVSLYLIRGMNKVEGWYKRIKNPMRKLALGAAVLSVLIFLFPPLYGEGYLAIESLISDKPMMLAEGSLFYAFKDNSWLFVGYLGLVVFFKVVAAASTNGAGGVGGVFAPSLFIGALVGFMVATLINQSGLAEVSGPNFALMGMAGVMSAVMHAPLTGVFLIAELTGGYELFLPLLMVSGGSFLTIYLFEKQSIYAIRLAQKGQLLTHHKDKAVLTLMKVENVVETDFDVVNPSMYLGNLVKVIATARRNVFPVVDDDNVLQGIVLLDDIRNIMFRTELYYRFKVQKLMISPPAKIRIDDPMDQVMRTFDDTNAWNLPVVDADDHYLGFVSKSKIFNAYRNVLVHFSDE
ncbi:MAG: chloride channel protein [Bacteroidales bacterium]|jgi:CIC family chloride channel protein|nr:chloride channel protein [Bacteroidales bacterium]OPZ99963.1 MAG: Voltage-gated ClC-type chloride channel ClcB [Bacteroidetes bacterium ADurb.Bin416]